MTNGSLGVHFVDNGVDRIYRIIRITLLLLRCDITASLRDICLRAEVGRDSFEVFIQLFRVFL